MSVFIQSAGSPQTAPLDIQHAATPATLPTAASSTDTSSSAIDLAKLKAAVDELDLKASMIGSASDTSKPGGWWSTHNAMTMSAAVLLFGAVVIALAAFASRRSAEDSLKLYGTIMIVTMAVFLVVAGYDDKQIAAPLGLLGTIVGYLLGRASRPTTEAD